MYSMTGFGKAELKSKLGKFTVEVSSVNNRFLEISQRLPRQFFTMEPRIRELIGSVLSRGKVSLYVGFDDNDGSAEQYQINRAAIKSYYAQLKALKKELKAGGEITMRDLMLLPDIARPEESTLNEEAIWKILKKVIEQALADLIAMRRREGLAMARDMRKQLTLANRQIKAVKKLAARAVETYRDKLTKRLEELLSDPLPDYLRIEEQIAMMAEKTDITEECTRFLSHLKQYSDTIKSAEPVGKRLNFILQEMNREANTIASKSYDLEISSTIISVKEEIEKMRELVQNVE